MKIWNSVVSLVALSACAFVSAQGLGPGSKAPAMEVKNWYKGTPVKTFDQDKTYVVEFWATWCGPCKESIPHLTSLAKKYPKVKFVGISIWEDNDGTNIKKFVKDMGAKMDYTVGYSGNQTGMSASWMKAAGQNGIPTAFVVQHGKISWIGHPMTLDEPLGQIVAGKFDSAAYAKKFADEHKATAARDAAAGEVAEAQKLFQAGKRAEAHQKIDAILAKTPELKDQVETVTLAWLYDEDPSKLKARVVEIAPSMDLQKQGMLVNLAFQIFQQKVLSGHNSTPTSSTAGRDVLDWASEATHNSQPYYLYGAGFLAFQAKDRAAATKFFDLALKALPNDGPLKNNESIKTGIETMQKQTAQLPTK